MNFAPRPTSIRRKTLVAAALSLLAIAGSSVGVRAEPASGSLSQVPAQKANKDTSEMPDFDERFSAAFPNRVKQVKTVKVPGDTEGLAKPPTDSFKPDRPKS